MLASTCQSFRMEQRRFHRTDFHGFRYLDVCGNNYPTRCNNVQFIYICTLLYMFRVVCSPIISSSYHCIYSSCHETVTATCRERGWTRKLKGICTHTGKTGAGSESGAGCNVNKLIFFTRSRSGRIAVPAN